MIQELVDIFFSWPTIVQGALGSALFWIVFSVGQRFALFLAEKYSKMFTGLRKRSLVILQFKYSTVLENDLYAKGAYFSVLTYAAMRSLVLAFIWLTSGLLSGVLLDSALLEAVGFIGSTYYLLRAYSLVGPIETKGAKKKLAKVNEELKTLEKQNKQKKKN